MTLPRIVPAPRLLPSPLPAIHPVPEYLASGALAQRYEETKRVLDVPWMGVVTMAMAHYPNFFEALWHGARPLADSTAFEAACRQLRRTTEREVLRLAPGTIEAGLERLGYGAPELDRIRDAIEVFSHGNYPYLLLATVARLLLEGHEMQCTEPARVRDPRPVVPKATLVLMEAHHADAPTRALYAELQAVLGLPFVNTDYRALARWPSYFALAWSGLRPAIDTQSYRSVCAAIHADAVAFVLETLPNPGHLSAASLRAAAAHDDAGIDEVLNVCRLFQWLLPGLVTNIAYFRKQLAPG